MVIIRFKNALLRQSNIKFNCVKIGREPTTISKRIVLFLFIFTVICYSEPQAAEVTSTTVRLTWTASADNGPFSAIASYYDLRYALVPITNDNWESANIVNNVPAPNLRGSAESFVIMELTPEIDYYFAIKVGDNSNNWSELSNVVRLRTASPPICGDLDESGRVDITDLVYLIAYMFIDGIPKINLNASDFDSSGSLDVADLVNFVEYMFGDGRVINCP